jgi:hypothetical protein
MNGLGLACRGYKDTFSSTSKMVRHRVTLFNDVENYHAFYDFAAQLSP